MYRALFFKELIKLRWVFPIVILLNTASIIFMFLYYRTIFEFYDPTKVWVSAIHRQEIFYAFIKYNSLISAVIIALAQFIPETLKKRLKLLFHLPVNFYKSTYFIVVVGIIAVCVVMLINITGMVIIISYHFPSELVTSFLVTTAPWYMAGFVSYLGVAGILIEPSKIKKIIHLIVLVFIVTLFFSGKGYNSYEKSLWQFMLIVLCYGSTIFTPVFYFKRGIN